MVENIPALPTTSWSAFLVEEYQHWQYLTQDVEGFLVHTDELAERLRDSGLLSSSRSRRDGLVSLNVCTTDIDDVCVSADNLGELPLSNQETRKKSIRTLI
jgi:hypothetical protein